MSKTADLITEAINPKSADIDLKSVGDILALMNSEDFKVPQAVKASLPQIEKVVEQVVHTFRFGGRLFYLGAGSSGRIGVLDAVECPPTFGVRQDQIQGIIAGGYRAMIEAIESAEDNKDMARQDISAHEVGKGDIILGLTASGRTPYVIEGLRVSKERGACTAIVCCNPLTVKPEFIDYGIEVVVGPEVIAGSTRLKATSAIKMVVNMISTASLIKMGRTFGNLMVCVNPNNTKLYDRAIQTITTSTGLTQEQCQCLLEKCGGDLRLAVVVGRLGISITDARRLISISGYSVRQILESF